MTAIDASSDDSREARRARARAAVARGNPAAGQRQRDLRRMSATIGSPPSWRPRCSGCRRARPTRRSRGRWRRSVCSGASIAPSITSSTKRAGTLSLTHEWCAAHLRGDEGAARVRAHAARRTAAAVPGEPAARRRGARPPHAPVPGHAGREAGGARRRSRAGPGAGGRGGRPDRRRGLRRGRGLDLGAGRHGSAAARGAGGGAHGGTQARRRRAARRGGPLPGDVRRLAAGHLPGGHERRRAVPESGRPAHHRPRRGGDGGARLDERPAPGRPRARRRPVGHRRSRRAAPTRPRCIASFTRTARCVRSRSAPCRSPASPRACSFARHPGGRHRPAARARRSARICWRAPRRRAWRPRRRGTRRKRRAPTSPRSCRASRTRSSRSTSEGRYTYANDRALAMCGRTRDEIIGQNAWDAEPAARRRAAAPRVPAGGGRATRR